MLAPKLSNNLEKRERIVMFNVFNDNMTKNKTFIFLLECVYCSNSLYNKKSSFLGLASIFMLMFLPWMSRLWKRKKWNVTPLLLGGSNFYFFTDLLGSHHAMPSPPVKSKPKPDLINSLSLSPNNDWMNEWVNECLLFSLVHVLLSKRTNSYEIVPVLVKMPYWRQRMKNSLWPSSIKEGSKVYKFCLKTYKFCLKVWKYSVLWNFSGQNTFSKIVALIV